MMKMYFGKTTSSLLILPSKLDLKTISSASYTIGQLRISILTQFDKV
jgi:hypothetical protein